MLGEQENMLNLFILLCVCVCGTYQKGKLIKKKMSVGNLPNIKGFCNSSLFWARKKINFESGKTENTYYFQSHGS